MTTANQRQVPGQARGLEDFSGRLPIFPLPNLVLFPGMKVPLHIFEPRYRAMTAAAMQGEQLMGMALLEPGWKADYEGTPAVHPVVCVGRMLDAVPLPDGRYNFVLAGLQRARIDSWLQEKPFRLAAVTLLEDQTGDAGALSRAGARLGTIVATMQQAGILKGWDSSLESLGPLTDALAAALRMPPASKQELLAEIDLCQRASKLANHLHHHFQQARLLVYAHRVRPEHPEAN